jgi:hypothetical protein
MENENTHLHYGKLMNHKKIILFLPLDKLYKLLGHKLKEKMYSTL